MLRRSQLAWLQITQLSVFVVLVLAGVWLWFDAKFTEQHLQALHAAHPRQKVLSPSAYTFPAGGKQLFPKYRMVALYGAPDTPVLGALGHQNIEQSIVRVKQLAKHYQKYSKQNILPTLEIIATIASAHPTENNDYSRPLPMTTLKKWVDATREAGVYVILDLQSGRSDFLSQAKQLQPLLLEPHVGLALDPEWRLKPHQIPLVQIGAVSATEVNQTANWLAALTRTNKLPQKVFLLHQFRMDMLPQRELLTNHHRELAYAIQMDGQGSQHQKQDTWRAITNQPPANTRFGWKNFYTKDTTVLSPKDTMRISPKPWYVSYQ